MTNMGEDRERERWAEGEYGRGEGQETGAEGGEGKEMGKPGRVLGKWER